MRPNSSFKKLRSLMVGLSAAFFCLLRTGSAQPVAANYKDFPQRSVELTNGVFQCGYFDETNQKFYSCRGKEITTPIAKVLSKGDCCVLYHVAENSSNLFKEGTATFQDMATQSLDSVVNYLKSDAKLTLIIDVYSGKNGNRKNNQELSESRADSIQVYLSGKGISETRVITNAYGERKPPKDSPLTKDRGGVYFDVKEKEL